MTNASPKKEALRSLCPTTSQLGAHTAARAFDHRVQDEAAREGEQAHEHQAHGQQRRRQRHILSWFLLRFAKIVLRIIGLIFTSGKAVGNECGEKNHLG